MLRADRLRAGWSIEEAARRLRMSVHDYRRIEVGIAIPSWEAYDANARLFGWPRSWT